MNVWASFAGFVPGYAADVIGDLAPVVALLGGIALAVSLAGVLYRVLRGGR